MKKLLLILGMAFGLAFIGAPEAKAGWSVSVGYSSGHYGHYGHHGYYPRYRRSYVCEPVYHRPVRRHYYKPVYYHRPRYHHRTYYRGYACD